MSALMMPPERSRNDQMERLAVALLATLDSWLEQLDEIEAHAVPGNKGPILHLMKSIMQAKHSMTNLIDHLSD